MKNAGICTAIQIFIDLPFSYFFSSFLLGSHEFDHIISRKVSLKMLSQILIALYRRQRMYKYNMILRALQNGCVNQFENQSSTSSDIFYVQLNIDG